eukprot:scaffold4501_cov320-Pinguiococcus_pyrenoidosus.AAC.6
MFCLELLASPVEKDAGVGAPNPLLGKSAEEGEGASNQNASFYTPARRCRANILGGGRPRPPSDQCGCRSRHPCRSCFTSSAEILLASPSLHSVLQRPSGESSCLVKVHTLLLLYVQQEGQRVQNQHHQLVQGNGDCSQGHQSDQSGGALRSLPDERIRNAAVRVCQLHCQGRCYNASQSHAGCKPEACPPKRKSDEREAFRDVSRLRPQRSGHLQDLRQGLGFRRLPDLVGLQCSAQKLGALQNRREVAWALCHSGSTRGVSKRASKRHHILERVDARTHALAGQDYPGRTMLVLKHHLQTPHEVHWGRLQRSFAREGFCFLRPEQFPHIQLGKLFAKIPKDLASGFAPPNLVLVAPT